MQFYIYLNGVRRGPFSPDQVRTGLKAGLLQPTDLASTDSESHLQPLSALLEPPPAPAVQTPVPAATAKPAAPSTNQPPPNEAPVYRTTLHWIIFVRFFFLGLLVFFLAAMPFAIAVQALTGSQLGWFALPLPAFIMLAPTMAYTGSALVVTNLRLLIKSGVIRRQTLEMFIAQVEPIVIDQSLLGRLLDYGTVVIRGPGGLEERFNLIARPTEFRNWVQRMQKGGSGAPSPI